MGRAIDQDMYEGNAARQIPDKYREPVYDRRERTESRRRESAYDGGNRRPAVSMGKASQRTSVRGGQGLPAWKEPAGRGRERMAGGGTAYNGRNQGRAVRREAVYNRQGKRARGGRKKSRRQNLKRLRCRILGGLCFYFLVAGIIATCWMAINFFFGRDEKVHAEEAQNVSGEIASDENPAGDGYGAEGGMETEGVSAAEVTPEIRQECQDLYARQESLLLLVNKERELPASYQPVLHSICKGRLEAADILYEDLCAMLAAGEQAGYQYWIASAYRDRAYQQGLVEEDVQKYMAKGYTYEEALRRTHEYTMPAGQSEHETGLALDILCSTNTIMDESQKSEPGNQWLVRHCHEYGFILRYPENKEGITGIGYEPWHFRYVGKEAAAYLTSMGWTLEEFYQVLES